MSADAAGSEFELLAVTGRFQPFHVDHLALVRHALGLAARVLIGITNPDGAARAAHPTSAHRHLADANPYSYAQREQLIDAALRADGIDAARVRIVAFPLDEPQRWPALLPPGTPQLVRIYSDWEREKARRFAAAGYPPRVLQGDPATRVTATEIRRRLAAGEPWQHWVPPGARELLAEWRGRVR